jgi:hypothetical protein
MTRHDHEPLAEQYIPSSASPGSASQHRGSWWTSLRVRDGVLVEHWDVIEDEVSREASVSGLPMFGNTFPEDRLNPSDSPADEVT